jgi:hypothetical protein
MGHDEAERGPAAQGERQHQRAPRAQALRHDRPCLNADVIHAHFPL